ncbi:MAG: glycosyltransferase, partial [Clostridia bacterium]|nr:glycosyltransferase [Clostridia bacterium]
MNIVQINYGIKGSTGTIMLNIAEMVRNKGDQCVTFSYPKKTITTPQNHIFFGSPIEHLFHRLINAITGFSEIASIIGTKKLLKELDEIRPDIIHLHNLHGWYVNLPMLFRYIKKNNIPVVWTLHDCWAFTGHCP